VSPDSAFNTAVSFVTNTNWQGYGGESTMSYLTQMLALAVQNFLSAATGIAVVIALIRGFARARRRAIGNFWVDLTRITTVGAVAAVAGLRLFLVGQGVIQNFDRRTKDVHHARGHQLPAAEEWARTAAVKDDKGNPVMETQAADADPRHGTGRVAGSHQDARHQRRRLLQRQLGAPLREPDGADQLPADAGDLPDPGRPCALPSVAWWAICARAGRAGGDDVMFVVAVIAITPAEQPAIRC
jgi:hypothetical protein